MNYPPPNPRMIPARWKGGAQNPRGGLIVLHSTVGPCKDGAALSTARYFQRTDTKSSAHYCVDPGAVIQCVGDHTVAYHCGYNQDSIGVEMCEYPSKTNLARWFTPAHRRMRRRTVVLVAQLCLAYGIRPYYVDAAGLRAGRKGITTHAQMSLAFKRSTHWDPGTWPRRAMMLAVRREIARIKSNNK